MSSVKFQWPAACAGWGRQEALQIEAAAQQYGDARAAEAEAQKDAAYEERNRVVALLAALLPSVRTRTAIEGWSEDWHGCVYITLPDGSQASWHFHDSQAHLFAHVPEGQATWDGHTTPEKYTRIERCTAARPNIAAAPQPNSQGILNSSQPAEALARQFHEAYERLAPQFGYETRAATRQFDPRSPNGRLMVAVCAEVMAAAPQQPATQPVAADAGKPSGPTAITAAAGPATNGVFCSVDEPQQPAVQPEPMARFCPGCGSVGPVPEKYRDCCPDGDKARMIPEALARHCRDLFQLALSAPGDALHPQQPAAQPASAEPVAEVTGEWHSKHIAWLPGSPDLPLGAKLYTLPRDPAEVMRLAEDAQRWRFWRQHWQLLTRMEVARPAGIDLSRRGVYSPDEMDEVTDAALARAVGAKDE